MKTNLYIYLLGLFTLSITGQGITQTELGNLDSFSSPLFMASSAGIYINNYGSGGVQKLFLFKDFDNNAILFDREEKKYKISNFNVDLTQNQFVSMYKKDSLYIFQNVKKALINNHLYFIENNQVYEMISDGDLLRVLLHYYPKEMEEVKDKLNGKTIKPKHFVMRKEYVIEDKLTNKKETLSRIKKKTFLSLFQEQHKKKVQTYIKKNQLDYKDKVDLKSIFDYYNSLK